MDSIKPHKPSNVSGLIRTFAKVLRLRATGIGVVHGERIRKIKFQEKESDVSSVGNNGCRSFEEDEKKLQNKEAMEALLAKLFASISSVKAAYAELQYAQSPYDPDTIQAADEEVVTELKLLSELKQSYSKKQFDSSPKVTLLLTEIQEQKSLLKTYEITGKKLESQSKLKESEITFLMEKLEESEKQNRFLEKRLDPYGSLYVLDDLYLSGLDPNHFVTVLRCAVKSIRSFVKLMIEEMKSSSWDLDAAASSIERGIIYAKPNHRCFTFESFVCREMFDGFQFPRFSLPVSSPPDQKQPRRHFFDKFMKLKSINPSEFLLHNPNSSFGKFCRTKYLNLVHPKMESSFFGNSNQRNLVKSGGYPETNFFTKFMEMAKQVWLLHCLAFSFDPEASIFQVKKGCRFSEVFMESVVEDGSYGDPLTMDLRVGFTVVPGFRIRKTLIQCQVYLTQAEENH